MEILRAAEVAVVADVRGFSRPRSDSSYNIDALPEQLAAHQIGYRQVPALGSRRKLQPDIPNSVNGTRRNRSFHNYADCALSPEFGVALEALVALGRHRRLAMLCSEAA